MPFYLYMSAYQSVVENIVISDSLRRMVRFARVFEQDARFQLGASVFANPGEFEFRLGHGGVFSDSVIQ